ncbi:MAG: PAS domain S-box-containing protein [Desulforhopalus sp.]|jgi:PAS domain S-box-containing protein
MKTILNQPNISGEILIVDDTTENLKLLKEILENAGYKVRAARNGKIALLSIKEQLPDLILLDIIMPELDGYEVCRRLKSEEKTNQIPVLFLSALNDEQSKKQAFEVGGVDFITKPFQADEILSRVQTHLSLYRMVKRLEEKVTDRTAELLVKIKQQEQTEKELRESEERFSTMFHKHGSIMLLILPSTGAIIDANIAAEKFYGYPRETLLRMKIGEINTSPPDVIKNALNEVFVDGQKPITFLHKKASGDIRTVEVHRTSITIGGKENLFSIINDITERKQAEEKLLQHEYVVSSSSDMLALLDTGFKYLTANQSYLDALKLTRKQLIGKTASDVFGEEVFTQSIKPNANRCLSGKEVKCEEWFTFPGQRHLYMEFSYFPYYQNNEIAGFIINGRDATDRQKLEAKLHQAQRMESIGTLAGGIAHDFNNILSAILGYAELARDDCQPGSTIFEDLNEVLEASNRAKSLVHQILAFSRQDDMERIILKPASIVKETITMLRPSLPTTIEITQDIDGETGLVFVDPTQLNQILMNLCTNAYHAMEDTGGKLNISLKEVTLSNEDLLHEPDVTAGTFIQLSIGDSGKGIAPTVKDKIFDPYFTTKETGKGTGMGLSIVHGIVKSYGGFISLYSELGEGTVFHVFLPTTEKEALTENEINDLIPIGRERILFVDDEEILTKMGKTMLERLGYHVTVRNSSLEALETFQNEPDKFDIVITDQTMPGMTGSDLSRRMLQIRPDIPIILCTGYSTIISEGKAKSMGIKEFAFKPLAKRDMARLIRKVLDVA